jgi:phenylalanyl-tRNA synthetase alpha chain
MKEKLLNIKNQALGEIINASSPERLEEIRISLLGKNGSLNEITKLLSTVNKEERAELGRLVNEIKSTLEDAIGSSIHSRDVTKTSTMSFDETLPGKPVPIGHLHPVTQAISEITDIFEKVGFVRVRYPEVDWDWYPFESLNMPKTHPARDEWETFFIDSKEHKVLGKMVLTPHTSNGQVREMERLKTPPIRMINIAKCYRRQSDVSHTPMFHQFEGLVVDKGISVVHLKGTIDYFVKQFFGPKRRSRLRPYHFQFTEPSFEVDVTCDICLGKAVLPSGQPCRLCKEGWLELGGAGMVHPNVLRNGRIDPSEYTGFAFGWGVERTYMMKSGIKIDDLRLLYNNDIRFLNQF